MRVQRDSAVKRDPGCPKSGDGIGSFFCCWKGVRSGDFLLIKKMVCVCVCVCVCVTYMCTCVCISVNKGMSVP
jgi:hypothetical protein